MRRGVREAFLEVLKVSRYTIQLEVSFSKSQGALNELDTHLLVSDRVTGKSSI